jgi:hypothetical protein
MITTCRFACSTAAGTATAGERVVTGQRIMQAVGDVLLGWQRSPGVDGRERDFHLRQLRDWKGGVDTSTRACGCPIPPLTCRILATACPA